MKKILFTIESFPSLKSANVLCDLEIINELKKIAGYEIHILVPKAYGQQKNEVVSGIFIHRFRFNYLWQLYTKARMNPNAKFARLIYKISKICLRIKQVVFIPIYPIVEPHMCSMFAREAIDLHRKFKFDLVLSEHNGVNSIFAGYKLKCFDQSIKFCPILWDPINGKTLPKYLPASFSVKRLAAFERKILNVADSAISMASNQIYMNNNVNHESYYSKIKFYDLPRLVKPNIAKSTNKYLKDDCINIVYAGLIADRFPETFILMLDRIGVKNLNVIIFTDLSLGNLELNHKLENVKVAVYDYINHGELSSVYENANFLLNLGGSNPNMLPSKIFEYMSFGKPIISTYFIPADCTISYLEKYPLSYLLDISKNEIDSGLKRFIEYNKFNKISFDDVNKLFPYNTPLIYVDHIKNMLSK